MRTRIHGIVVVVVHDGTSDVNDDENEKLRAQDGGLGLERAIELATVALPKVPLVWLSHRPEHSIN